MRPQDDIPNERIVHRIVKDYQRMFNTYNEVLDHARQSDAKIAELIDRHSKRVSDMQHEFKKKLEEQQKTRSVVVKDVTNDLEKENALLKQQVKALVQAFAEPERIDEILNPHIINEDDKKWLHKADKQLEKAMLNFTYIEEALENLHGLDSDKLKKKVDKIISKTDACVNHVEDFLKKCGNIKIQDNG